jgi:Phytanoyl-CoA dioxygenase (PhyH)
MNPDLLVLRSKSKSFSPLSPNSLLGTSPASVAHFTRASLSPVLFLQSLDHYPLLVYFSRGLTTFCRNALLLQLAYKPLNNAEQKEYEYQPLEVKKGTLVIFHGNLMHTSGMNRSEKNRISYTFSVIDSDVECPDDCYMKPLDGGFESL